MRFATVVTCAALAAALNPTAPDANAAQPSPNDARVVNNDTGPNIVLPPTRHPEVAVSRSLEAQPVHPHKVKVILNGDRPRGGTMHTWIDAERDLTTGRGGLDENHRIVRAQRLARMVRHRPAARIVSPGRARMIHRSGHGAQSAARLVSPLPRRAAHARRSPQPAMILHVPRPPRRDDAAPDRAEPIAPSRPHETGPKLVEAR